MGRDDPKVNAREDLKLAKELKEQAKQAERLRYRKVAEKLWDAYYALLEEAEAEEARARAEDDD